MTTPPISRRLAVALLLMSSPAIAEIKILTGDASNQVHNSDSFLQDISSDGDVILFNSGPPSSGSTPGITTGGLYCRKISTNSLAFVGDSTVQNGVVYANASDDGRYITWSSSTHQVYWRDVQTNTTRHITAGADGNSARPYLSSDGRYVAYASFARNLVADTGKLPAVNRAAILIYDSQTQTTSVGSLASGNTALNTGVGSSAAATNAINEFDLSADGRYLVFTSDATNSDRPAGFTAGFLCVYRRDLQTGAVVVVNRDSSGTVSDGNFSSPRISANGSRVVFSGGFVGVFRPLRMSTAAPVSFGFDVYVKDVSSGAVWWASRTVNGTDAQNGSFGTQFAISGDGNVASFASTATNIVAEATDAGGGHSGTFDIFRVDLGTNSATTTSLISKSPNGSGNVDYRSGPFLPGTGNYVAFCTSQLAAMSGTGNTSSIFFQGLGVGILPAMVPTGLSYTAWASPLPADRRGYNDTPAGDGVPNLSKYFLGMDPQVAGTEGLPISSSAPGTVLGLAGDSQTYLKLTFRVRRQVPPGFGWSVNASPGLVGLNSAGSAIQVGNPVEDGDFDLYTFRYPTPMTGTGFMNVKFTGP